VKFNFVGVVHTRETARRVKLLVAQYGDSATGPNTKLRFHEIGLKLIGRTKKEALPVVIRGALWANYRSVRIGQV